MRGQLYIDGIDAYDKYGVFVVENGLKDLVALHPTKKVPSVDWAEENGEAFDLSEIHLNTKEVNISFASHGKSDHGRFVQDLADKGYHEFRFTSIGKTYKLRLVSHPTFRGVKDLALFSLRFADDFPLEGYSYVPPASFVTSINSNRLDDKRLTDYGVILLNGCRDELLKSPPTKVRLTRNLTYLDGTIYDGDAEVFFKTKKVRLRCLMRARTVDEFWRNRDALLHDLSQSGERELYVSSVGETYKCFYNSCSAVCFYPTNKMWFEFDLTFTITAYTQSVKVYVLATEGGRIITTEDGRLIQLY